MRPAILVVDDEKIIRIFLDKTLGRNYDVVSKENGSEGLKWIQSGNNPDVIISDLHMPEMDGYEFLKQLSSGQETGNIPVIMLSGMESSEEKTKCLQLGANAYLTKPLNMAQLIKIIEDLLNPS
jgi:two-component system, chemotaxis family, chemotaxis protein CheY